LWLSDARGHELEAGAAHAAQGMMFAEADAGDLNADEDVQSPPFGDVQRPLWVREQHGREEAQGARGRTLQPPHEHGCALARFP